MEDNRKRNMDRRRETSRFAARDRRAKESDIYDDLKEVVPVVEEQTVTHVDRIALLRVAATVCRYRKNVGNALTAAPASASLLRRSFQREVQGESPWSEDSLMECLDGFIIVADSDGVILYVTESVSLFLGLTQTDFAGRHLRDFIAADDYKDYLACTQELTADTEQEESRTSVLRIKTVISPRGRNLNLKSAILKPVAFSIRVLVSAAGHCHLLQAITVPAGQGTVSSSANAITKGDTPSGTFMTRHTCDMRLSYVSETLYNLLKSDSRSLMGASYYELVHPADAERLRTAVQELLVKGHTRTPYYRLITGPGSVAWIMTEANTVTHTTRGQKGQYIIGIHHMLGQQTEEECDRGACEGVAAGLAVRIKQEPDDREYLGRQPEILDCVDFTPLGADGGEFHPVPQHKTRRGFGTLANDPLFNTENNESSAPARKQSFHQVLSWLFREQPERIGEEEGDCGGERREEGGSPYDAVQSYTASGPRTQLSLDAYGRSTDGLGGGDVGRRVGGGGALLQGASVQQQQPYGQQHLSPQNALSSSFSRACDLSSSPSGGGAASGIRSDSPLSVAQIERELRSEELHRFAFESGRGAGLPQTNTLPLPYSSGRRYEQGQVVLSSVPPAGFSAAEPLYGVRRGQRVNPSLVSSGYGSTVNSCSPSSSSSTSSSTPRMQQQPPSAAAVCTAAAAAAAAAPPTRMMSYDDGYDRLGSYAPYIDHGEDIAIGAGGFPKEFDLDSLLELPWNDGLPNFGTDMKSEYGLGQVTTPVKRDSVADGLFDDWPAWIDRM
ncbi:hypothetical protein PFISCL1PPCAC_1160 [Pristionchus fissidentatus]|uniref:Uncharacterized protein n=1 Tax=Pristionchus fissidentatus TaxID=1538716 RepID=A0AAV5UUG7_9BILA|nr:hypothetical protein PFISCL1PPCAC_1160 [Pristionchus fissidentatus]